MLYFRIGTRRNESETEWTRGAASFYICQTRLKGTCTTPNTKASTRSKYVLCACLHLIGAVYVFYFYFLHCSSTLVQVSKLTKGGWNQAKMSLRDRYDSYLCTLVPQRHGVGYMTNNAFRLNYVHSDSNQYMKSELIEGSAIEIIYG